MAIAEGSSIEDMPRATKGPVQGNSKVVPL